MSSFRYAFWSGFGVVSALLVIGSVGSGIHGCVIENRRIDSHIETVLAIHEIGAPEIINTGGSGSPVEAQNWWIYRCERCRRRWAGADLWTALKEVELICETKGEF